VDRLRGNVGINADKKRTLRASGPAAKRRYDDEKLKRICALEARTKERAAALTKARRMEERRYGMQKSCQKQGIVVSRHREWHMSKPLSVGDTVSAYSMGHTRPASLDPRTGVVLAIACGPGTNPRLKGTYTVAWCDGRTAKGVRHEDVFCLEPAPEGWAPALRASPEGPDEAKIDISSTSRARDRYAEAALREARARARARGGAVSGEDQRLRRDAKARPKNMTKWLADPWTVRSAGSYQQQMRRLTKGLSLIDLELAEAKQQRRSHKYKRLREMAMQHSAEAGRRTSVFTPDTRGELAASGGLW
jgi:hypothetical protein